MEEGDPHSRPRRWPIAAIAAAGVAVGAGLFVLTFRAFDSTPSQVSPEGAVLELRDHIAAADWDGAQRRLCADPDAPDASAPGAPAADVVSFFEAHGIEVTSRPGGRDGGDVTATVPVLARPAGDQEASPRRWVVHLERDPGGSGPMFGRSRRWLVCRVEPGA